tara:strand:- start:3254 stop:3559 length:306 start_codon:yes stop_codon:yes gene_type:complete
MFWTDEDIQPAIDLAVKLFGSNNRYEHDNRNAHRNVSIMTKEYGKIWFGDLELNDEARENMEKLSVTINQRVYLTKDFDTYNAMYITTSKLREIAPEEVTY